MSFGRVFKVSRRDFLLATGVAGAAGGAGLVLGYVGGVRRERWAKRVPPRSQPFAPSVWLAIDSAGVVTVWVHKSEMGQGVRTALPMLVAEELEADWRDVRVEQAVTNQNYGGYLTGNSTSVRGMWDELSQAGAAAREMLIQAAADTWQVESATCHARESQVIHEPSGRRLRYAQLVDRAATLAVPAQVPLKAPEECRLLGQPLARLDTPEKVDGRACFGIDVRLPGMLYAMVMRPPTLGGRLDRFDASSAKRVPGVRDVLPIASGLAVVGDGVWPCLQARKLIDVTWDEGPHAKLSEAGIDAAFERALQQAGRSARREGNAERALTQATRRVEATLAAPYLAHATMEPINCTARVGGGRCDIWAPTQAADWLRQEAAVMTGLAEADVVLHVTLLGGGFGRRASRVEVPDAIELAQRTGHAVQVVWTREDDIRHDLYRPASRHMLEAGLDDEGRLIAWRHKVAAPSLAGLDSAEALDELAVDGAMQLPYDIEHVDVSWVGVDLPVPLGFWRSVGHSYNAFAVETFVDRIARTSGEDPVRLRRRLLAAQPRHRGVLELVAERSGWDRPAAPGRYRGVAVHASFGSYVAYVAEVVLPDPGTYRVERVVAAVDCGRYVNPDTIAAQIEGGIVFGLSAASHGRIRVERGRIVEGNFHDYPLVRMADAPAVEVHLVQSREPPGGVGEIGVPPIAPAVANALLAATGRPVNALPIVLGA